VGIKMAQVFKKSALERLASPEQLDKAITVSNPVSWLALLGLTIIIAATIAWAWFGTFPTTLEVYGVAVGAAESSNDQITEFLIPANDVNKIKSGMKATIHDADADRRYAATITGVSFDDTLFSDTELLLHSHSIIVTVSFRLTSDRLPEKTILSANIIIDRVAPIDMLFKGISGRAKG